MNTSFFQDKKSRVVEQRRYVLFLAVCLMVFIYSVILYLPSPLLTSIAKETHWSLGRVGTFVGIFNLFSGIFTFFTSPLVDRFGTRKTGMLALVFAIIGCILALAGGTNYYIQLSGRILAGAGFGMMFPVPGTLISEYFPHDKASTLMGVRTTVDFMGCSVSFYVILPIYRLIHSWQLTFAVWGVIAMIPLFLLAYIGRRMPEKVGGEISATSVPEEIVFSGWGIALKQKWLWMIAVANLGTMFPLYGFATYLPTFLEYERGYSASAAAAVSGFIQIAGIFAGIFSGVISDALGRRKILSIGSMCGCIIGGLLALFSLISFMVSVGAFMIGFAVGMFMIFYSTVPSDILKGSYPSVYAACIGLTLGIGSIASALVPYIFQAVLDMGVSTQMGMLIFLIPSVLGLIPCCMIHETGSKGHNKKL